MQDRLAGPGWFAIIVPAKPPEAMMACIALSLILVMPGSAYVGGFTAKHLINRQGAQT